MLLSHVVDPSTKSSNAQHNSTAFFESDVFLRVFPNPREDSMPGISRNLPQPYSIELGIKSMLVRVKLPDLRPQHRFQIAKWIYSTGQNTRPPEMHRQSFESPALVPRTCRKNIFIPPDTFANTKPCRRSIRTINLTTPRQT